MTKIPATDENLKKHAMKPLTQWLIDAASASTVLPSGVISTEVIRPSEPKPWATVSDCTSPS